MDDYADILGGDGIPIVRDARPRWPMALTFAIYTSGALVAAVVFFYGQQELRRWREKSYRLAVRRRHGIDDSDHRPFNVAYADVKNKERLKAKELERERSAQTVTEADQARPVQPPINGAVPQVRQRVQNLPITSHIAHSRHLGTQSFATPASPTMSNFTGGTKRSVAQRSTIDDLDTVKRSRRISREPSVAQPKRGAKRSAEADTEDEGAYGDKRARKISLQSSRLDVDMADASGDEDLPEEMDEAELAEAEDQVMDLEESLSGARGKKRDRDAAGSTFGGDEDDGRERRRHKPRRHRTSARQSEVDGDEKMDVDIDAGSERSRRSSRRKARRAAEATDALVELEDVSIDPLCGGRRIGEEWEMYGSKFKVGPNGQRLRMALVKEIRTKFVMPADSQHPDKTTDIEVCVEKWLSEEEYQTAKEARDLVWQSPSLPSASLPDASGDVPESPTKPSGKALLWSGPESAATTPSRRGPFRQSSTTNLANRSNPFTSGPGTPTAPKSPSKLQHFQPLSSQASAAGRRVTSSFSPALGMSLLGAPMADGSPRKPGTPSRGYSKWEKQDLEAEAMAKMRQKLLEQRKATAAPSSPVASGSSAPPPTPATALPAAPTPTALTPAAAAPAGTPFTLGQGKPAAAQSKLEAKPEDAKPATPVALPSSGMFKMPGLPASATSDASKPFFNLGTPSVSTAEKKSDSAPVTTTSEKKPEAPAAPTPSLFAPPATNSFTAPKKDVAQAQAPGSAASALTLAQNNIFNMPKATESTTPAVNTTPAAPSAAPFAKPAAKPAADSSKPTFSFGPATGSVPAASSPFAAPSNTAKPPTSAFGVPAATQEKKDDAPAGSLFNRVGSFPAPTATSAPAAPATSAFSAFAKTTGDASKAPASAPAPGVETPKFNFGPTKPAAAAITPTTPTTATPSAGPPKSAAPLFSFSSSSAATPATSGPSTTTTSSAPKPAEAPKFNFFGGGSTANAFAPATTAPDTGKPAFGASAAPASPFGTPTTPSASAEKASSAFGLTAAKAPTTSFGATSFSPAPKTPAAGAEKTSSAFGVAAAKAPATSFGATSFSPAPATPSTPGTAPAASNPFSFNMGASGSTSATGTKPAPAQFSFGTPTASTGASTAGSSTGGTTPFGFGAASMGSATFSFGATAKPNAGSAAPSPFGAAPTANGTSAPAAGSVAQSPFGAAASGGTGGVNKPAFSFNFGSK